MELDEIAEALAAYLSRTGQSFEEVAAPLQRLTNMSLELADLDHDPEGGI